MKFLRIGNTVINPAAISKVEFGIGSSNKHVITLLSTVDHIGGSHAIWFPADSPEGKAIADYFDSVDNVRKLSGASEQEEAYQWYKDAGGTLDYHSWGMKYRRYQQLIDVEDPSDSQIEKIQQLSSELLY